MNSITSCLGPCSRQIRCTHTQDVCLWFQISNFTFVESVEQNGVVSVARPKSVCDQCHSVCSAFENWGLARISSKDVLPDNSTWPPYSYEKEMDVDIYVLDTGVLETHEEFEPGQVRWGLTATDAADSDRLLEFGPDYDYNGHGTHVAGTAAGNRFGVAKNATVIAVKVLNASGDGTYADLLEGLIFAATNASQSGRKSVINLSLSAPWSASVQVLVIRIIDDMGISVLSAAGNEDEEACSRSPAGNGGRGRSGITVAASNRDDVIPTFSNYGGCVDLFAPGGCIRSAHSSCDSCYRTWAGTSMSAPHVSGVVARLMAATGITEPVAIKAWITGTAVADKITIPNDKRRTPNLFLQSRCFK